MFSKKMREGEDLNARHSEEGVALPSNEETNKEAHFSRRGRRVPGQRGGADEKGPPLNTSCTCFRGIWGAGVAAIAPKKIALR